jgi:hypothetical protein
MLFTASGLIAYDNKPNYYQAIYKIDLSTGNSIFSHDEFNPQGLAYDWENNVFYSTIGTQLVTLDNTTNLIGSPIGNPITSSEYSRPALYGLVFSNGKSTVSGITNSQNEDIKRFIYPNPTRNILFIQDGFETLKIYDISGVEISTFQNNEQINLAFLPEGVYFLNIIQENKAYSTKLVKE